MGRLIGMLLLHRSNSILEKSKGQRRIEILNPIPSINTFPNPQADLIYKLNFLFHSVKIRFSAGSVKKKWGDWGDLF